MRRRSCRSRRTGRRSTSACSESLPSDHSTRGSVRLRQLARGGGECGDDLWSFGGDLPTGGELVRPAEWRVCGAAGRVRAGDAARQYAEPERRGARSIARPEFDGKSEWIEPMAARLADGDEQCLQQPSTALRATRCGGVWRGSGARRQAGGEAQAQLSEVRPRAGRGAANAAHREGRQPPARRRPTARLSDYLAVRLAVVSA